MVLLSLLVVAGCADGKPEQPVRNQPRPAAERQAASAGFTIPDKSQNYCYVNLKGKKTWSSFIWRGDSLKITPRDTRRAVIYVPAGKTTWKDRNGTGTYEFFKGGAIWKANNGSGKSIRLREC